MAAEVPGEVVLRTIFDAYTALCNRVNRALVTQIGDEHRLAVQREECNRLLADIELHRQRIPPQNLVTYQSSIHRMVEELNLAVSASSDEPDVPPPPFSTRVSSGRPGRPHVNVHPQDLSVLSTGRARNTELAILYDCSSRTIRRRRVDFGLSQAGPPVYNDTALDDGTVVRTYYPGMASNLSNLTNDELDQIMLSIYYQFPSFGRRMLDGYLVELGERVPRRRVEESYRRVVGPSTRVFGPRRLVRREYNVPGPNSLWHHDGQHGLIRWKIVIHAFIDGLARFVLGIRASNNNLARTVLDLFEEIAAKFGYPSRVRGDHGGENQLVAGRQEEVRGLDRGSYIFGRSVHNIRVERLWVDVTSGFGSKWAEFFRSLELFHGLDINLDAHIWLLHFLFLGAINADADRWMRIWNNHVISGTRQTPTQLYTRGSVIHGQRSIFAPVAPEDPLILNDEEQMGYGIDWQELDRPNILAHHRAGNEEVGGADPIANAFVSQPPERFTYVHVPEARCPLTNNQVESLTRYISSLPQIQSADMHSKTQVWDLAQQYCRQL